MTRGAVEVTIRPPRRRMTPEEEVGALRLSWDALMRRTRWDGGFPPPWRVRCRSQAARDALALAHELGYVRWSPGQAAPSIGRSASWREVEAPALPDPSRWPRWLRDGFIRRHPDRTAEELAAVVGLTPRGVRYARDRLRRTP